MQTKCPLDVQLSGERKSYEIIAKKTPPLKFSADFRKGWIPSVCVFNEVQLRSTSFLIYILFASDHMPHELILGNCWIVFLEESRLDSINHCMAIPVPVYSNVSPFRLLRR